MCQSYIGRNSLVFLRAFERLHGAQIQFDFTTKIFKSLLDVMENTKSRVERYIYSLLSWTTAQFSLFYYPR